MEKGISKIIPSENTQQNESDFQQCTLGSVGAVGGRDVECRAVHNWVPEQQQKETKLKIFSISFAIFIVKQFSTWSRKSGGKKMKNLFRFHYKLPVFISEMRKLFFNVLFEVVNPLCGRQHKPTHTDWLDGEFIAHYKKSLA